MAGSSIGSRLFAETPPRDPPTTQEKAWLKVMALAAKQEAEQDKDGCMVARKTAEEAELYAKDENPKQRDMSKEEQDAIREKRKKAEKRARYNEQWRKDKKEADAAAKEGRINDMKTDTADKKAKTADKT